MFVANFHVRYWAKSYIAFVPPFIYEFLLDLEATNILGIKVDLFLMVTEEHRRRIVQFRLISNLLRSKVWITAGLLTIFQIVARILATSFPVAPHWLAILREEAVYELLVYPADLMQRVSPELSDQLSILQSYHRYCSEKTQLIDGDDHLEEQLNVLRTAIEVY